MKQKIAFLFLKTGGGHLSASKAISEKILNKYPDQVDCVLKDGLENAPSFFHLFFEKGYLITSNYFKLGYLFFYRLTSSTISIKFLFRITRPFIVPPLCKFLKEEKITKVVCLHEGLISMLRIAIDRVNPKIVLISIVMDPFTAHATWFYEKNTELIVFSEKLKKEALHKYHFDPAKIYTFPVILSEKFDVSYTEDENSAVKKRLKLEPDKKVVLIVGGGEGLREARSIVHSFRKSHFDGYIIVVCGKDKILKNDLELFIKIFRMKNVILFGFVSFMPDLINIADCVITKGGPATIMEILLLGKPLIMATYIRGQELGNMLYVTQNKVGWYIPNSEEIVKKTESLLFDENLFKEVQQNIRGLTIKNGLSDIVEYIYKA